jgi:hypothetical protein
VLHEQPDGCIVVDVSQLFSDLLNRIQSGEKLERVLADLEYGIDAEVCEFIRELKHRIEQLLSILKTRGNENMLAEITCSGLYTSTQLP